MKPLSSTRNYLIDDNNDFDFLENLIIKLGRENEIVVIGDINARSSVLNDIITNDCANFNPIEDVIVNDLCITDNDLINHEIPVCRNNEDNKTNDFGHKLVNLCKLSGLLIGNGRLNGDREIGKFTYIDKKGKSAIDYALISKGLLSHNNNFHVQETNIYSDHCPIVLNLYNLSLFDTNNLSIINSFDLNQNNDLTNPFTMYKIDEASSAKFLCKMNDEYVCSNLNSILEIMENPSFTLDNDDVENCILGINHVLEYATADCVNKPNFKPLVDTYASNVTSRNNNNNPWYDKECRNKKKEFITARDLYYQTFLDKDLYTFCNIRNAYRKLSRKKKKEFNFKTAKDLVVLSKENSKLFWKKLKRKAKKVNATCDFHIYFKNLFETPISNLSADTQNMLQDTMYTNLEDDFLDDNFSLQELDKALKKLKNDKSPGHDNILNEFLKLNTSLFKKTLLSIFNVLFNLGYFPDAWSVGLVIPIFKKGNPNEPENYRGITLLSCIGKLFTSMINTRLNAWAEINNKFDKHQYGFRDKRGTIDAMFILQNIIDIFLKQNSALFVCFVDLQKAFDCTNHNALWYKLNLNQISSKIVNLLRNMYDKMKLCKKFTVFF